MRLQTNTTLLVVDDDPLALELAYARLSPEGYRLLRAVDGVEAIETMKSEPVDIVLTDIDMPNLDGLGLLQSIKGDTRTSSIPVVLVTGLADDLICRRAIAAGADAFIRKPLDWALVRHQIASVLRAAEKEAALRHAEETAQAAVTMRDNLLSILSHELRTPLNSTIGFARLLSDEIHGPLGAPEYREYAKHIADAGEDLNQHVSDLVLLTRVLSKAAHSQQAETEMKYVIGGAISKLRSLADEKRVDIRVSNSDANCAIVCDPHLLSAALFHLVRNAIQHSPSGSVVTLGWKTARNSWSVEVTDQGAGIDERLLNAIQQPFMQAQMGLQRTANGMGVGLSIAAAVAEMHGASLHLDRLEAGGTRALIARASRPIVESESQGNSPRDSEAA
ncbi:MAG: hybrid sensor histidine kinase/response regulator [Pseudomonadota bacterium]